MATLHEDQYTFFMSLSVHLRKRSVSDSSCRENRNTLFMFNKFFPENHAIYEIMWKNIVDPGRPQMPVWCMCIACWITKTANTHSRMCNIYCFFHCRNGCMNAPQCYFIHTLPLWLIVTLAFVVLSSSLHL